MTQQNKEGQAQAKQVTFTGAAMVEDRIRALERDMAELRLGHGAQNRGHNHQDYYDDCDNTNYDDRSYHDQNYRHGSCPLSGRDYRDDREQRSIDDPGSHVNHEDEDGDPNNWDEDTLNAYIESLVALRDRRRQSRNYHQ